MNDKILIKVVIGIVILYSAWTIFAYYVHATEYSFATVSSMAEYVGSRSGPNDELFGDSMSAPLVALLSDRKIALDEADTNIQRFSGTTDINLFLSNISTSRMKFVIASPPPQGITNLPETQMFIQQNCQPMKAFDEPYLGNYTVYQCG